MLPPKFADAHNNLGTLLQCERKDVAGAESAYCDATAADPKFADAHDNLEYLLNNMKTFRKEAMTSAIQIHLT